MAAGPRKRPIRPEAAGSQMGQLRIHRGNALDSYGPQAAVLTMRPARLLDQVRHSGLGRFRAKLFEGERRQSNELLMCQCDSDHIPESPSLAIVIRGRLQDGESFNARSPNFDRRDFHCGGRRHLDWNNLRVRRVRDSAGRRPSLRSPLTCSTPVATPLLEKPAHQCSGIDQRKSERGRHNADSAARIKCRRLQGLH
jgi:hypothetical protein